VLVVGITLACAGCDHLSKNLAREELADGRIHTVLGGALSFRYTENPGGMLSMGSGLSPEVRFSVFTVGVGIMLMGMLAAATLAAKFGMLERASLSLIVGGGLGNLIDRVRHGGVVTDFLTIGIGALRTGIFNAADVAVVAGGVLLVGHAVWMMFFHRQEEIG
jgi:signal peptidase II